MDPYHPDLRLARWIPRVSLGPRSARLASLVSSRLPSRPRRLPDVTIEEVPVPGRPGTSVRLYRPVPVDPPAPAVLWMHGGGFVLGAPEHDDPTCLHLVRQLGAVVASVRYRLAPAAPAPAALDDASAALDWLVDRAPQLGVDPARIAVAGASAGGGLAAALVQRVQDRGAWRPAFQLLVYPMLDDRTVLRSDLDTRWVRAWEPGSNRTAWCLYLGQEPGLPWVPEHVVPARRTDLAGLPPAWIGVGDLDLFLAEDTVYARRLRECGVACELLVVPGAFHGFDAIYTRAEVSRRFLEAQTDALRRALW